MMQPVIGEVNRQPLRVQSKQCLGRQDLHTLGIRAGARCGDFGLDLDLARSASRTRPSGPRGYVASRGSSAGPSWRPRLDAEDRVAWLSDRPHVPGAVAVPIFQLR